jgi:uncharacterized protein YbjT (DUF2867 family)
MKTVGIFPAAGGLGTSTLTHLLPLIPPSNLVLVSRNPSKLSSLPEGVQTRQAAYGTSTDDDFKRVFAGIDVLFLISYPSHERELRVKLQLPVINAAHAAGVRHIIYSSLGFALPDKDDSLAEVMGAHLDSEEQLKVLAKVDQGFSWTSVREGLYHESYPIYTSFLDPKNPVEEVLIPHDGAKPGLSWVKRDELGEATAKIIAQAASATEPTAFPWRNKVVVLTGPTEWSLADTVAAVSSVVGKPIRIKQVSVDEYVAQPHIVAYFGSEHKARTWATAWAAIRAGEAAHVSPTLEELLGRKPEAFDVTLSKMIEAVQ